MHHFYKFLIKNIKYRMFILFPSSGKFGDQIWWFDWKNAHQSVGCAAGKRADLWDVAFLVLNR